MSLIAISVTSCCVGLSLRSRDFQSGSRNSKYEMVTSSKRAANCQRASCSDDDDAAAAQGQFCQVNCDSSSTLDRATTRRTRAPPVPPAPINHVNQPQRYLHHQHRSTTSTSHSDISTTSTRRTSTAVTQVIDRITSIETERHPRTRYCSQSQGQTQGQTFVLQDITWMSDAPYHQPAIFQSVELRCL